MHGENRDDATNRGPVSNKYVSHVGRSIVMMSMNEKTREIVYIPKHVSRTHSHRRVSSYYAVGLGPLSIPPTNTRHSPTSFSKGSWRRTFWSLSILLRLNVRSLLILYILFVELSVSNRRNSSSRFITPNSSGSRKWEDESFDVKNRLHGIAPQHGPIVYMRRHIHQQGGEWNARSTNEVNR